MNSIILIGNKDGSDTYISDFIRSRKIKPYYIERFSETLKIAHVREMKKKLSVKLGQSENRLFIIEGDITIEGQNALLKVLEEPASWAFFVICVNSAQDVLPTIVSRCQVVLLNSLDSQYPQSGEGGNPEEIKGFDVLGQNSYALLYPLFEKYQFFATLADLEEFILDYRLYILKNINEGKILSPILSSRFIKICQQYSLVKSNNFNRRSVIETTIITTEN